MKKLHTEIEIDASAEIVWETLLDFGRYPEWNPFLVSIDGDPTVGSRLRVRIQPFGGRGATFKPTVTTVEPGKRLEWLGSLGFKGVFDGRHQFAIEETAAGAKFIHSEEFTGILVPLFARNLDRGTKAGFELMNAAIKEQAENTMTERG